MGLNEWYEKGLTPVQYIESIDKLKKHFLQIYNNFTPPADENFFQSIKDKNLRVIVLAEEWCGHCMLNIPVLLRFAEKVDMPVRFLPRDENLELMDQYLTNGKSRTIPIFIFIDENGQEIVKWGPIADNTRNFVDQHRVNLPAKDAENYGEAFTNLVKMMAREFRDNPNFWNGSYISIKQTLENM